MPAVILKKSLAQSEVEGKTKNLFFQHPDGIGIP